MIYSDLSFPRPHTSHPRIDCKTVLANTHWIISLPHPVHDKFSTGESHPRVGKDWSMSGVCPVPASLGGGAAVGTRPDPAPRLGEVSIARGTWSDAVHSELSGTLSGSGSASVPFVSASRDSQALSSHRDTFLPSHFFFMRS
jgi:hypothetical protein